MTSRTPTRGRVVPILEVLDRLVMMTIVVVGLVAVLAQTAGPPR